MAPPGLTAIIPARGGSKSIPGKNRKMIAGRPLVGWVIAAALEATRVNRVVVATDDQQVADISRSMGAAVHVRSAVSATDEAPTELVLKEVAEAHDVDGYVLLQPTSPLTTGADVDGAIEMYEGGAFDSVLSVVPQWRFVWLDDRSGARPWNYDPRLRPRRQDADPVLVENGAIYVSSSSVLRREGSRLGGRIGVFRMSSDTYHELDEPADWDVVERLLAERAASGSGPKRWAGISLVLSDVDGVLTDNGMYWSSDGSEMKKFSARDGKGFELLHRTGVRTGLLTSESAELVSTRGAKLGCFRVELGCVDKLEAADRLRDELALDWAQVAFVGDDVHDLPLLARVGASFAPADAVASVRSVVDHTTSAKGGNGCFREVADLILEARTVLRTPV